jgi:hypothetical protein
MYSRLGISLVINNCGQRPAILKRIFLKHDLMWDASEKSLYEDDLRRVKRFLALVQCSLWGDRRRFEDDMTFSVFSEVGLQETEQQDAPFFRIFGRVEYDDVSGESYFRNFYWRGFLPPGNASQLECYCGPDEWQHSN